MPIYEYRCAACGHHLEALQKMSEAPLRKCPECGKSQLRRLVSASRFRLKGSGWYETDFKTDGEKKRNLVEKAGADSSDANAAKSDDGKSAASKDGEASAAPTADKAAGASREPAKDNSAAKRAAPRKKPAAKPRAGKSARR
jgi:putative FmdB family regulatory protein